MSVYIPNKSNSYTATVSNADLSAKVGYGAKVTANKWVLADDNNGIGIIADGGVESGDYCTVVYGECMALTGGAIGLAALVSFNASGLLIAAVSGDAPVGRCLQPAGSGEWGRFNIYGVVDESVA